MTKFLLFFAALIAVCSAGLVPAAVPAAIPAAYAAPLTVGTYATSYNAHAINHAVAAPYVAAPAFAASPYVAHAAAPAVAAAPLAYSGYPAAAYAGYPAAAYVAGRR